MAATARREIDTGEEDIAAIAKQISDHAEAIYQTWKARGLAPTEILSCRPTPGLKLAESLRTKPKPEPKPEIKQRPEFRNRPEIRERPELRDQRPEPRRDLRLNPETETVEIMLPPDLVPERNGAGSGASVRRPDNAAMRLEVAREEERLLRALRTGGVVAERPAERPDVVPPISLVDYAKSRYQDRLDTGARKPAAGASGERRASFGSHVTEARSKFEARARRASSAGAAGEAASAQGATPVRPFLTRGSVAERVLMFERCPSEATLELAKRKSPAATTWRGPHDVIIRAQNYAASTPPKPSSAPPHTTLQRSVRAAPSRVIPRFHFPRGRPPPAHQQDHAVQKVQSAFATFPNSQNYAASTPPKPSSAPPHTTLQRSVRAAPSRVIPRFHFPRGRPPPAHQQDHAVQKVQSAFATFPNSQREMLSKAVFININEKETNCIDLSPPALVWLFSNGKQHAFTLLGPTHTIRPTIIRST
ncbi:uncharacterized protein LOC128199928 [Bicyclus anynana]|uniref:Uncharacterized protein LOC128199928 n=1 Tax=Bicyclus anynana TaxID=110368 RepID=A0ABM3M7S5_BICAN|nr:uncharacterized protein LOC128199928 [Bicyclus anynana]